MGVGRGEARQGGGGGCDDDGEDTDVIKLIFPVAILKWPIMGEQEREIVAET